MVTHNITELLAGLNFTIRQGSELTEVNKVVCDSRSVKKGALFVAIAGELVNGHDFIQEAIRRGCSAVIVESDWIPDSLELAVTVIEVVDSREALALAAGAFCGHPAQELVLIGITGTNGKTTTSYLVEEIIKQAGGKPGVIGTVNYRHNGREFPAPFTTPEPVILQSMLLEMLEAGVTHVIMEVSSHALVQKRVFGIKFQVALFTNLSRDHLDFHGDMEHYFQAKKTMFSENLTESGTAVILSDSPWGERLADELSEKNTQIITCGFGGGYNLKVVAKYYSLHGTKADFSCLSGEIKVYTALVGSFNLKNTLGAAGVGLALGYSCFQVKSGLNSQNNIPGRLEKIQATSGPDVYVDYAHTPDALQNVLAVLKELSSGKLIVVFGCGGDRDQGKRSLMGEVAGRLAHLLIITSDNSRSESTSTIMSNIAEGVKRTGKHELQGVRGNMLVDGDGFYLIASRHAAIEMAFKVAREGDVVLIAGKGHETCQIDQGKTYHFDDREEALSQLSKWNKDAYDH